ncbi:MAG: heme NO-binding domain-containing protein [Actinomycetota bacterium]
MKGVIFNAFQDAVERGFGPDGWDDTLDRADAGGSYTSLGNYDDAELVAIVGALPSETGDNVSDRLRWIGINCVPFLVEAFPQFFEGITLKEFLPALNHMIHPEVRKLYPGATPPDFDITELDATTMSLRYVSERKLCFLAEGFTMGVASHLGQPIRIDQPMCMHEGDPYCELRIRIGP